MDPTPSHVLSGRPPPHISPTRQHQQYHHTTLLPDASTQIWSPTRTAIGHAPPKSAVPESVVQCALCVRPGVDLTGTWSANEQGVVCVCVCVCVGGVTAADVRVWGRLLPAHTLAMFDSIRICNSLTALAFCKLSPPTVCRFHPTWAPEHPNLAWQSAPPPSQRPSRPRRRQSRREPRRQPRPRPPPAASFSTTPPVGSVAASPSSTSRPSLSTLFCLAFSFWHLTMHRPARSPPGAAVSPLDTISNNVFNDATKLKVLGQDV